LLWQGEYKKELCTLADANPQLTLLFSELTKSRYTPRTERARNSQFELFMHGYLEFEAIFSMLCHMKSRKNIPLVTWRLQGVRGRAHARIVGQQQPETTTHATAAGVSGSAAQPATATG